MSQGWSKIFNRINWLNRPSTNTPLNATNLNAGDSAIDKLDDRIITLDTVKADMQVVNGMVADVSLNSNTGVITVTYKNGSHVDYDTNLEKIAVNFSYDYVNQRLVLTLSDGSKQYVDMSALITQYEFKDSTTIAFSVDSTGKISASVKNGSITDAMLETGYLANIKVEVAKAEAAASQAQSSEASSDYNAKLSRSYAIGGSGIREGEDTDNAMYYYEQARKTDIGQIRSEVDELNSNLDTLEFGEVAGGKNICKASDNGVVNEITLIKKGVSTIIISGASGSRAISKKFNVKKGVTYTATFFTSSTNVTGFLWNSIKQVTEYPFGISKTITFTPTEDETLSFAVTLTATVSNVEISIQVEEGSKSTSFEPYIPSVKMLAEENTQIDDLNVLGWVVPEEMPIKNYTDSYGVFHQIVGRVDLGTLNWTYDVPNTQFYTDIISQIKQDGDWIYDVYCSKYITASYGDKRIALNGGRIYIGDSSYTDGDSLKFNLRGVYLYFELSTPITMTIDGNEAVTKIKNDLSVKSGEIVYDSCEVNDSSLCWCKKSGHVVQCSLYLKNINTTNNWQDVVTLPFRPCSTFYIYDSQNKQDWQINTEGKLRRYTLSTDLSMLTSFTYITND